MESLTKAFKLEVAEAKIRLKRSVKKQENVLNIKPKLECCSAHTA